jgi:3-oxoacyl-[acyl-carrier-protein] synthase-1/3-oxoacyl-[acyl-carrier-protein] synthase II
MNLIRPVAVSGAGCLCAAGMNLTECMENLFSGRRRPAPPKRVKRAQGELYPVFEIEADHFPDQDPEQDIFRTSRLALAAARETILDSGWEPEALSSLRVGVIVGTTVGATINNEEFYESLRAGGNPDMRLAYRYFNSNPAEVIARRYGLSGPVQTIVNACSSGTEAVGIGASWIRADICDVVLAGGADELNRAAFNGFISLLITGQKPCTPFDRNRAGLNLGEGAGMLLLESDTSLKKRKKRPRAFVTGYGSATDAYHLTAPSPTGEGLKRAIAEVTARSATPPEKVAFVNAHGTGTAENDRVEGQTLAEVLPGIPFCSTKGYTGHTLGAAGAIEAAFTIACLEAGAIPANVGFTEPDPEIGTAPVTGNTKINGTSALSLSLAFGGNNAALMLSTTGGEA